MPTTGTFAGPAARHWGVPPLFDPAAGQTVREPLGEGPGWWVGASSACRDPHSDEIFLYFRYRKPRELGRGVECRIAVSSDGVSFTDVWAAGKSELQTQSMEKAGLFVRDGRWDLYLSFVGPDGRWRIERVTAKAPTEFDVRQRAPALTPDDCGAEGVKDPAIYAVGGRLYMLVSYAPRPAVTASAADMHATGDVYNTGLVKSHTGLAVSADGEKWEWAGDVLTPPPAGWDSYCTRISSVLYQTPVWLGFYDGSASVEGNYEERAGLCVSHDLRHWERVSVNGPCLVSPHASRSVRYVEALPMPGGVRYYYEYARADGSHELRTAFAPLP
ncbi:MAG: hypothetical protein HPY69_19685 [Armatimonadetes bacterium]|nr:hypothetical protein [Armatimonadota bacterium]